jgi:hypothetical protein
MRPALAAAFAVLAFSAVATSTASAVGHPLFLTQNAKTLLFTGLTEGKPPVLRGEEALGHPVAIECEKGLVHGFVLHASTLAHLSPIRFEGKCVQKINGGLNETCNEPIETKKILAELGLASSVVNTVLVLLAPSDGTETFAEITCGLDKTTVKGAIVGVIPEINKAGQNQYENFRTTLEVVFATSPAGTDNQEIKEIFLLGVQMKGVELKVEGFLAGARAAEEANAELKGDGQVRIDLTE